jgi:hypothetical protein
MPGHCSVALSLLGLLLFSSCPGSIATETGVYTGYWSVCEPGCVLKGETIIEQTGVNFAPPYSCEGASYRDSVEREIVTGQRYTGEVDWQAYYSWQRYLTAQVYCPRVNDSSCPSKIIYKPQVRYGCERDSDEKLWWKTRTFRQLEGLLDSLSFDEKK